MSPRAVVKVVDSVRTLEGAGFSHFDPFILAPGARFEQPAPRGASPSSSCCSRACR